MKRIQTSGLQMMTGQTLSARGAIVAARTHHHTTPVSVFKAYHLPEDKCNCEHPALSVRGVCPTTGPSGLKGTPSRPLQHSPTRQPFVATCRCCAVICLSERVVMRTGTPYATTSLSIAVGVRRANDCLLKRWLAGTTLCAEEASSCASASRSISSPCWKAHHCHPGAAELGIYSAENADRR